MRKTERELTDIEMIDALMDIFDIILTGNNEPIRESFTRSSRAAQIGYDIELMLLKRNMLELGPAEGQIRIETTK